jgi:hypothetical protein
MAHSPTLIAAHGATYPLHVLLGAYPVACFTGARRIRHDCITAVRADRHKLRFRPFRRLLMPHYRSRTRE